MKKLTKSINMRIDLLKAGLKNDYIFQISNGTKTYLSSSDYQEKKTCIAQLKEVLVNLRDNEQIAIQSGNNKKYYFEVLGHAQSPSFDDIEAASDILVRLKDYANSETEFKVNYQKQGEQVVSKKQLGLREELYNFDKVSTSQQSGFELIEEEKKGRFFHFNDAEGNVLLYSRMYDGKNRRIKAILDLIKNCKEEQRYQLIHQDAEHYFIFKTKDGYEIGRSRMFEHKNQMESAIAFLKKETVNAKKAFKLPKQKKKKKQAKEKYHLKQMAPLGLVGFEGFKSDKNKLHYFHYHDEGGQALLYSKPFEKRKLRDTAIAEIINKGGKKKVYKTWKKSKNQFYFSIIDKKGKSFARSRYFTTEKDMSAALKHLRSNVEGFDQEVNIVPITKEKQLTILLPEANTEDAVKAAALIGTTTIAVETALPEPIQQEEIIVEAIPEEIEEVVVPEIKEQPDVIDTILPQPGVVIETEPAIESISTSVSTPPIPEPVYESKTPFRKEIIEEKPSGGFPWKWIWLILALLALAALLLKMCGGEAEAAKTQTPPPKPVTEVTEPIRKEPVAPAKLGPTALELELTSNTAEARIADFLSLPEVNLPKVFILESVQFPFSSAELTNTSFTQLDNVVKVLTAYPKAKISVNGHTDSRGDDAMNLTLSENRAQAVRSYLLGKGIGSERIVRAIGFGETEPIATNDTDKGRQENRRSELVVVER